MINTLSAPIYMGIDLTERCNLRCLHCRVSTSSEKKAELPLKRLKFIIDEISRMKVIQVIFSGGEPLLRKDIFEILKYSINKGIPDVIMVSNGTLLDKRRIEMLKETGIKKVIISLDGLNKSHDKIRGAGTFELSIKSIKQLIKDNFEVRVTLTLNQFNKDDVIGLSKFLNNLGVKHINVGNLMPCGRGKALWTQALHKSEKENLIKEVKKFNESLGNNFILFESSFLVEPVLSESDRKIESFLGCRGGRTYCAILANGDIVGCKMLPHIVAGNILEESFKSIWRDDKRWSLWRGSNLSGRCSKCKYGSACRGGCKAMAFHKFGRVDLPDPRCIGPF